MNLLKKVAVIGAVTAMMGALSAPAMAKQFRWAPPPGQPLSTGQLFEEGPGTFSLHCDTLMELWGMPGHYPGLIIIKTDENGVRTVKTVGPEPCPVAPFYQ